MECDEDFQFSTFLILKKLIKKLEVHKCIEIHNK